MALLTGEPRTASIRAATPVSVIKITRESFEKAIEAHPSIQDEIWEAYAHHTLDNYLRSESSFQTLSAEERKSWIHDGIQAELSTGTPSEIPGSANFAFVASGEVRVNGQGYIAPSIIEIQRDKGLSAVSSSRVVWLPKRA